MNRTLRRTYGRGTSAFHAVRGVDLDVPTGSITALLGTNAMTKLDAANRHDAGVIARRLGWI